MTDQFDHFMSIQKETLDAVVSCGGSPDFTDRVSSMLADPVQAEAAMRLLLWRPLPPEMFFLEGLLSNAVDGSPRIGMGMAQALIRCMSREQMDERLGDVLPKLLGRLESDSLLSLAGLLVEFGMIRHFGVVADRLEVLGDPGDQAVIDRLRNDPRNPSYWRRSTADRSRNRNGRAPGEEAD